MYFYEKCRSVLFLYLKFRPELQFVWCLGLNPAVWFLSSQGSNLKLWELIRACYLLNYPHILLCSQPRGQISLSFVRKIPRSSSKKFARPPIKISQVKMNRNSDIYGAQRVRETESYKILQIKIDRQTDRVGGLESNNAGEINWTTSSDIIKIADCIL